MQTATAELLTLTPTLIARGADANKGLLMPPACELVASPTPYTWQKTECRGLVWRMGGWVNPTYDFCCTAQPGKQ
jgi:hypothetical protein